MPDYALLEVQCSPDIAEILIAEMAELGFESFQETEEGFTSSIEIDAYNEEDLHHLQAKYGEDSISLKITLIEKENWNKKWEENYDPVYIDNEVLIRAPFHKTDESYKYDIVIMPQMSFGTGHHTTTELMIRQILQEDIAGKSVLDAGCGTGVLGIVAAKRGAQKVVAFDIEDWAVQNAEENFSLNGVSAQIMQGSVDVLPADSYDIIFANINKNVLMEHMEHYFSKLDIGGRLIISGFYPEDVADLVVHSESKGFKKITERTKNNWALLILGK